MKRQKETFRNVHVYRDDYEYITQIADSMKLSKCKVFQGIMQFAKKNMSLSEFFEVEKEPLSRGIGSRSATVITAERAGQIVDILENDEVRSFVLEQKGDTFVILN